MSTLELQETEKECTTCGNGPESFVYAIGRVEPRFPLLSVEKEFAQAAARAETTGLTDRQSMYEVLSKPENRYLARHLCWVLTIEGIETYILAPQDPSDYSVLIDAIRPAPSPLDVDVVIGVKGPVATPDMCNGLMVPVVYFDQIYSFDRDTLIKAIPRPESIAAENFEPAAAELFDRIMQIADNAGDTAEHRALNYCVVRYPAIYARTAQAFGMNASLSGIYVEPARLGGPRNIQSVVLSYTHRATDVVDKFFLRVDVTEKFPFLVTKLSPYYDRT